MFISEIIHNALVVLGELAARSSYHGLSPKQIAQENYIPQEAIDRVAIRLSDLGFILITDEQGVNTPYSPDSYLHLAKHSDEVYVSDIIKKFNIDAFNGTYIDVNGRKLPKSSLTYCINQLRCRGEQFVEAQMRGISINVLATWSSLKKGASIEQEGYILNSEIF